MGTLDIVKLFALCETDHSAILSEAFFEPQVIPPFHSNQVTEPHVRQLMDSNFVPLLKVEEGLFFSWSHEGISHYHNANVLHAINSELRDKDHVIFLEREWTREVFLKIVNGNLNCPKSFLWLCKCHFSFSAIDLHWNSEF